MRPGAAFAIALSLAIPANGADVDYGRDVKPILAARCFACHGAARQKGRLRLDAAALIRKGGRHGPVVVPGKSGGSLLIDAVRGESFHRVPPENEGEALDDKQIALLAAWIDQGARMPDEPIPPDPRKHWAYQPIATPPVPAVARAVHPIDVFLAAERDKRGLPTSLPVSKATLLRRVYLDLVGLPPTRAELHAFLADDSPGAYEKVVDRLLASPQYGERWARHWMDVWRYSDPFGNGDEYRYSHRHVWRWRDWIVQSLCADKGYDRMVVEMLAGDEVAPADPQTLRATGYLARNWYKFNRNAWLQDTVEHTAAGFLGLTLRCCRCHDHKYDPVSQAEYYRFRAIFEPHDVRIDAVPGQPDTNKDGVARVFDASPAAPTYLFVRGDDRMPDKSRALTPGVPSVLGGDLAVRAVELTPRHFASALETVGQTALRQADADVQAAKARNLAAEANVASARRALDDIVAGKVPRPTGPVPFLHDTFAAERPGTWKAHSGQWAWEKGALVQKQPGPFGTLVSLQKHPQDFMGRLRYVMTGGPVTSTGLAFDVVGATSWQAVYTYAQATNSAVQAFHRTAGAEAYPAEGIVPTPLKLHEELTIDFAVRGNLLNVWVNGDLRIAYRLPLARQAGVFALWAHEATAVFREVRLCELPASVRLAEKASDNVASPINGTAPQTRDEAERALRQAQASLALSGAHLTAAVAEQTAAEARLAAERTKYREPPAANTAELALAAGRAERLAKVAAAQEALLRAERTAATAIDKKAIDEAAAKVTAAKKALEEARAAAAKVDPTYTPLLTAPTGGSTGRRLALARWIASRDNPLTARVAVNHVWTRHFGKPLVSTVANFGPGGKPPSHPQLLDWLAARFIEDGWSQKKLHRLLVTSQAYRLSSHPSPQVLAADPDNRWYTRMNARRMEAEVVRDSLLVAAGGLDGQMGGPPLDEKLGQTVPRRSLYFRYNTEYKMLFLDQFDAPSPTECYERRDSVVPQQALALANSALALTQARRLAGRLGGTDAEFVIAAFEQVLGRPPSAAEAARCARFLREQATLLAGPGKLTPFPPVADVVEAPAADPRGRAREGLIHALFNHNDFVTVR